MLVFTRHGIQHRATAARYEHIVLDASRLIRERIRHVDHTYCVELKLVLLRGVWRRGSSMIAKTIASF